MQVNHQVFSATSKIDAHRTFGALTEAAAYWSDFERTEGFVTPREYCAFKQFSLALLLVFSAAMVGVLFSAITKGGL